MKVTASAPAAVTGDAGPTSTANFPLGQQCLDSLGEPAGRLPPLGGERVGRRLQLNLRRGPPLAQLIQIQVGRIQ
jgi:hypothetical protein